MAGVEFGGDRGKAGRQVVDADAGERLVKLLGEVVAANEAGTGQADIEVAEHTAYAERARPFLQIVELFGGIAAADHGADRGADDHVRHDAVLLERAHDADMSEAARRAAAERKPDRRPRGGWRRLRRRFGGAVAVAHARKEALEYQKRFLPVPIIEPGQPFDKRLTPTW